MWSKLFSSIIQESKFLSLLIKLYLKFKFLKSRLASEVIVSRIYGLCVEIINLKLIILEIFNNSLVNKYYHSGWI
ncbi:hypothetical protein [Spiroplasma endosymbiont of Lasioglossum villosulum]|uniref:hypothetical protein n=1 Tax=Spiroplasma endosymbiont of Lasioglossum villosulum TaxID=3066320 RepID=UPI0030D3164F